MTEQQTPTPKPEREWWQHPAVIIVAVVAVVVVVIFMFDRADDRRDELERRQRFDQMRQEILGE